MLFVGDVIMFEGVNGGLEREVGDMETSIDK